jgi:hypothetical protein
MACNPGLTYKYEYTGASMESASPGHNNHSTKLDKHFWAKTTEKCRDLPGDPRARTSRRTGPGNRRDGQHLSWPSTFRSVVCCSGFYLIASKGAPFFSESPAHSCFWLDVDPRFLVRVSTSLDCCPLTLCPSARLPSKQKKKSPVLLQSQVSFSTSKSSCRLRLVRWFKTLPQ